MRHDDSGDLQVSSSPRRRQNLGYAAGVGVGLLALAFLLLPGNDAPHVRGPMNTGHEGFRCESCHESAPGTVRQQLQANVRHLLGLRATAADFGRSDVGNTTCIGCHERRDDRHPVYRFLEPRFAQARRDIAPQRCESCHREHAGQRVTLTDIGYCATCHGETKLKRDPLDVSHTDLIKAKRWETCLGCHDFHGNHIMKTARKLQDAFTPEAVRAYFAGAASPYGKERRHKARKESDID